MRSIRTALLFLSAIPVIAVAAPALAQQAAPGAGYNDVKAGVDAWERGDYPAAVAIWRPLAINGDPDAQFNLGQAYKLGRGVSTDLAQAEAWYRRASKQGHLQADDNLGLVLFTANRREEAMPFIIRAAGRGEPRAQYVLGTAHFNGDLAPHDWPRSYALTKRASDAGLQIASARLAQLDRLIPLEQRQQGLAMLPGMEQSEQRERLAAVAAATPPPPAPPPSPVKTAALPASVPGISYTPPPALPSAAPIQAPPPPPRAVIPAPAPAPVAAPLPAPVPEPVYVPSEPVVQTPVRAVPMPIPSADIPASTPVAPGTSYEAPPESGDLPSASDPAPTPAPEPAYVAPAPAATPVPAPAPRASGGRWRVQLGAFSNEGNARGLWLNLEKKHPSLLERQPYLAQSGKLTRLQAGDFNTRGEAEKFCSTLTKGGQACVVTSK